MDRTISPTAALRLVVIVTLSAGMASLLPNTVVGQSPGDASPLTPLLTVPPGQTVALPRNTAQASGTRSIGAPVTPVQAPPLRPRLLDAPPFIPLTQPSRSPETDSGSTEPGSNATDRITALENQNREMSDQLTVLSRKYEELLKGNQEVPAAFEQNTMDGIYQDEGAGPIQSAPSDWPPGEVGTRNRGPLPKPIELEGAELDLSEGIRLRSKDGFYRAEIHNLSQFDVRIFSPTGNPLVNNFDIPRQRLYFKGDIGDMWSFYSVLNRGYGSLDVLDSYAEFRSGTEFHLRAGRFKVPFAYEYFQISEDALMAGERSVFVGNLSGNRQIGAMAYGRLWDQRFEYAVEISTGPERGFQGFTNSKSYYFYTNNRPFLLSDIEVVKNLNLGAAYDFGFQNDPLEPNAFHTANDETTTAAVNNVSPTFLQFNPNATLVGMRSFWTADMNWYYKNMTATAQYNGGYITYQTPLSPGHAASVHVPFSGYSVGATYFLTGERITARKDVKPLKDFKIRSFLENPGGFELFTRWANLTAGDQIYNFGLVNPNLWSRNAVVLDNGVHWYPNRFVRITTEYQLSEFSSPVQINTNKFTSQIGMFWFRTQLFY